MTFFITDFCARIKPMEEMIQEIKKRFLDKINQAKNLAELDEIYLELFGKKGEMTLLPRGFSKLAKDDLKSIGPLFNKTKLELEKDVDEKRNQVREGLYKKLIDESFELKKAQIKKRKGHFHPLTIFEQKIVELFAKLSFQQYEAPHIDTDYNVYEVLNIPKDSPARDLQDTFYIDENCYKIDTDKLILRGHTSNSEVRFMKEGRLPARMMLLGRCFRYENLDARHEHTFDQFEIVYIDKGVNMANLQFLSEYFLKAVFGSDIKARLRTKYYPQVEPGAGIDGLCIFCKGNGCKICAQVGWLELGGAGMIHPVALKNGGINTEVYSGLAWGISPERMVMLIEGVEDIRLFRNGDLKFLEQF